MAKANGVGVFKKSKCERHQEMYFFKCDQCFKERQRMRSEGDDVSEADMEDPRWDNSEERCQGIKKDGNQCSFKVAPGKRKFCKHHCA